MTTLRYCNPTYEMNPVSHERTYPASEVPQCILLMNRNFSAFVIDGLCVSEHSMSFWNANNKLFRVCVLLGARGQTHFTMHYLKENPGIQKNRPRSCDCLVDARLYWVCVWSSSVTFPQVFLQFNGNYRRAHLNFSFLVSGVRFTECPAIHRFAIQSLPGCAW